jgi:pyridoxamine 5'-phosphate oxidase
MVYLKELDDKGFVIYSNFGTSNKNKDIKSNSWASLTFWWRELERQVRVEGTVERLSFISTRGYGEAGLGRGLLNRVRFLKGESN